MHFLNFIDVYLWNTVLVAYFMTRKEAKNRTMTRESRVAAAKTAVRDLPYLAFPHRLAFGPKFPNSGAMSVYETGGSIIAARSREPTPTRGFAPAALSAFPNLA
jgi:hypothetical protein